MLASKIIDSEKLKVSEIKKKLKHISGVLIPGGFGKRGTEGKIEAIAYARKYKVPFFGIFGLLLGPDHIAFLFFNLVETFGPNSRVIFPFRRIEKLRDAPRKSLSLNRMITLVNRIFPFTSVNQLSQHCHVSFAEPESPTRTRYFNYNFTLPKPDGSTPTDEDLALSLIHI